MTLGIHLLVYYQVMNDKCIKVIHLTMKKTETIEKYGHNIDFVPHK